MTHRNSSLTLAVAACSGIGAASLLAGCAEDPPPPPPVVQKEEPKYEPPPPPRVPTIAELMAQYDIDPRVNLPEDRAPETEAQRVAVLKFFDSFARGNADSLRGMLSGPDQFLLDELVKSGAFSKSTGAITKINVRCANQGGNDCTLAIFQVADGYQPQLWSYNAAGSTPEFDSVATPPAILDKIQGDDPIASWFSVLKLELAKANEADASPELKQEDFTEKTETPSEGETAAPGRPAGSPGRRMPGAPVKPPKPPGFGSK